MNNAAPTSLRQNQMADTKLLLFKALKSLKEEDFSDFKWYLENINISVFKLENAGRRETVDLLVQNFPRDAVEKTIRFLKNINRDDLVGALSRISQGGLERSDVSGPGPSVEEQSGAAAGLTGQTEKKQLDKAIVQAVAASKERGGLSILALYKALTAQGYDVDKVMVRINNTIKRLVDKGTLLQTKGTGALKMNKKDDTKAKKQATTPTAKGLERSDMSGPGPSVEEQSGAAAGLTGQIKKKQLDKDIVEAVAASKERGGLPLPALYKTLDAQGCNVDKIMVRINNSIKRLVDNGTLLQAKGSGALKMNKKAKKQAAAAATGGGGAAVHPAAALKLETPSASQQAQIQETNKYYDKLKTETEWFFQPGFL